MIIFPLNCNKKNCSLSVVEQNILSELSSIFQFAMSTQLIKTKAVLEGFLHLNFVGIDVSVILVSLNFTWL